MTDNDVAHDRRNSNRSQFCGFIEILWRNKRLNLVILETFE